MSSPPDTRSSNVGPRGAIKVIRIGGSSAAGGLKVLHSYARVDLLVTDVGLPGGMNGRQMADAARLRRPGLKVLFITGYAECAVIGRGRLGPGMQVLTKPFAMDALGARVRDLVTETEVSAPIQAPRLD